MNDSEWLAGLKPGDEVGLQDTKTGAYHISTVVSTSERTLLVGGWFIYRDTGQTSRGRMSIIPVDCLPYQVRLAAGLERMQWRNLPLATLERVAQALEGDDER